MDFTVIRSGGRVVARTTRVVTIKYPDEDTIHLPLPMVFFGDLASVGADTDGTRVVTAYVMREGLPTE